MAAFVCRVSPNVSPPKIRKRLETPKMRSTRVSKASVSPHSCSRYVRWLFQHHGQHCTFSSSFFCCSPLAKRVKSHSLSRRRSQAVHKMVTPLMKWRKVRDNLAGGSFCMIMRSTFFSLILQIIGLTALLFAEHVSSSSALNTNLNHLYK